MTYEIAITRERYREWKSFSEWDNAAMSYNEYLRKQYPDSVISCSIFSVDHDRTFTFKSEQHYHWFLLQQ